MKSTWQFIKYYVKREVAGPTHVWMVHSVDAPNLHAKLQRVAGAPATRWIPYNTDMVINVGDKVHVLGKTINDAIISHRVG